MPSLNQNITLSAGDSVQVTIQLRQIPSGFNADGLSAIWVMGSDPTGTAADTILLTKTSEDGTVVITPVGKGFTLTFTLAGSDTAALGGKRFYHEMTAMSLGGDRATITSGRVFIAPVLNR